MEITSALQSEQHVKKELAKKLGQLQEKLAELKETVTPASAAEAPGGAGVRGAWPGPAVPAWGWWRGHVTPESF